MAETQEIAPLLTTAQIADRVAEMGEQIAADYAGRPLTLLGVLRGSTFFLADLARAIGIPVEIDFVGLSSYGLGTESSGTVEVHQHIHSDLRGRHILIVEDIIDTGRTLEKLFDYLQDFGPESVAVCTLLSKPARRLVEVPVTYTGFEIPDQFVIGYGLDYANLYRNLPYIGCLSLPDTAERA